MICMNSSFYEILLCSTVYSHYITLYRQKVNNWNVSTSEKYWQGNIFFFSNIDRLGIISTECSHHLNKSLLISRFVDDDVNKPLRLNKQNDVIICNQSRQANNVRAIQRLASITIWRIGNIEKKNKKNQLGITYVA